MPFSPPSQPRRNLRILHLEDSRPDADLIGHEIHRKWPDCEIRRATDRREFTEALVDGEYDLILSDYTFPAFNGLSALDLAHRHRPKTPFIFISGTLGEDHAIESLKKGATDYVLKDRRARLVPAIQRALDEVAGRQRSDELEALFLRSQRLESVGLLAGGIAHDLNNVLAPISMSLEMMKERYGDPEVRPMLDILEASTRHGTALIRQVLAFARGADGERAQLDLRSSIRELVRLLGETFPRSITIDTEVSADVAPISSNSTQFGQVLINLCLNARDAMPDGGRLLIDARNVEVDEAAAAANPGARAGPHVAVKVADNGIGIRPESLDRIFDPFYTTKSSGKGTGLGLSTVLGIVKSHGGFLNVRSEYGRGTEFTLHFPALAREAEPEVGKPQAPPPRGAGETLLFIDDEDAVRGVGKSILEAYGYSVLAARDGATGIRVFRENARSIRAVITDMMMPRMQGAEVISRLRETDPDVRVVAISGLLEEAEKLDERPGRLVFLQKPMTGHELIRAVQGVLATPRL